MASVAVSEPGLNEAQRTLKIKSFDPTKADDYEFWEEQLNSILSERAKASLQIGRPTYEMAKELAGATATEDQIDLVFSSLFNDFKACTGEAPTAGLALFASTVARAVSGAETWAICGGHDGRSHSNMLWCLDLATFCWSRCVPDK